MTLQQHPATLPPRLALREARRRLGAPPSYTGRDLIELRTSLGLSQAAFGLLVGRCRGAIAEREIDPERELDLMDCWALLAIDARLTDEPGRAI